MRDIVLRLTPAQANLLRLMAEHAVRNVEKNADEETKLALVPDAKAAIAKLTKHLKSRKLI